MSSSDEESHMIRTPSNNNAFRSPHLTPLPPDEYPIPPPLEPHRPSTLLCIVCRRPESKLFCDCGFVAFCCLEHRVLDQSNTAPFSHARHCPAICKARKECDVAQQNLAALAGATCKPYDIHYFPQNRLWRSDAAKAVISSKRKLVHALWQGAAIAHCDPYPLQFIAFIQEQNLARNLGGRLGLRALAITYMRLDMDLQATGLMEYLLNYQRYYRQVEENEDYDCNPYPGIVSYRHVTNSLSDDNHLFDPLQPIRDVDHIRFHPERLVITLLRVRFLVDLQAVHNFYRLLCQQTPQHCSSWCIAILPEDILALMYDYLVGPQLKRHELLLRNDRHGSEARSAAIINLNKQIVQLMWPFELWMWDALMDVDATFDHRKLPELSIEAKRLNPFTEEKLMDVHAMWQESSGSLHLMQQCLTWAKRNPRYRAQHNL